MYWLIASIINHCPFPVLGHQPPSSYLYWNIPPVMSHSWIPWWEKQLVACFESRYTIFLAVKQAPTGNGSDCMPLKCLPAWLLFCLIACLLYCLLTCLLACLFASLPACLLACWSQKQQRGTICYNGNFLKMKQWLLSL